MKHTIYNSDSYEVYPTKEMIQSIMENEEKAESEISALMIEQERQFYAEMDFESEEENLNKPLENNILIIADLGLWNGRKSGYKIIKNNLKEILYSATGDYYHLYYDGFNVCARDSHHDGVNYYTFREIKSGVNIDNLLDKIYSGIATQADINRYTKSLRPYVKQIYGW